jgi:hypothetical protein
MTLRDADALPSDESPGALPRARPREDRGARSAGLKVYDDREASWSMVTNAWIQFALLKKRSSHSPRLKLMISGSAPTEFHARLITFPVG